MNELIEKRSIIDATEEIEEKLEKMHCLLGYIQNLANDDIAILLNIFHDYLDQVLEQTEGLRGNMEEKFKEEYRKVISIA